MKIVSTQLPLRLRNDPLSVLHFGLKISTHRFVCNKDSMGFNMLQHLVNVLFSLKRIEGYGGEGCLLCINLYEKVSVDLKCKL